MYGKLQKKIGFSLIIFAFFFLFEPSYGLVDIFPDVIGYVLLVIALANLADINDRINSARKGFCYCVVLSALRFASVFLLDRIFGADERPMGRLIFVFLFAFFEIVLLLPAYKALFEGLLSLAIFHNGETVHFKKREKGRNRTEKLYSLTIAFLIIKNLVCALPDFASLQTSSDYEFMHIARAFAIIIVLPFSISWIVSVTSYFLKIRREDVFVESLCEKYIEFREANTNLYVFRPISAGLTIILASLILSLDLYSQNVNFLPDVFFLLPLLFAFIVLKNNSKAWKSVIVLSSIGSILSLFLFIVEKSFFDRHFIGAIRRDLEAYRHYYFMLGLYFVSALVSVSVILLIGYCLYDALKKHASANITDASDLTNAIKGARVRLIIFALSGILAEAASVYHIFSLPLFSKGRIFEYSGIISSVLSIAFIASSVALVSYVRAQIKASYRLDQY